MVSSCYSGGFYDDFSNKNGVSMITSSDKEHTSNCNFQWLFFKGVYESGMNDYEAYEYAKSYFDGHWNQIANPLASLNAWHCFFGH